MGYSDESWPGQMFSVLLKMRMNLPVVKFSLLFGVILSFMLTYVANMQTILILTWLFVQLLQILLHVTLLQTTITVTGRLVDLFVSVLVFPATSFFS